MKIKALLAAVFLAVAVAPALYATPAAAQAQQTETLEQQIARLIAAGDTAGIQALIRANASNPGAMRAIAAGLYAASTSGANAANRAQFAALALATGQLTPSQRLVATRTVGGSSAAQALLSSTLIAIATTSQVDTTQVDTSPFTVIPVSIPRVEPPKICSSNSCS